MKFVINKTNPVLKQSKRCFKMKKLPSPVLTTSSCFHWLGLVVLLISILCFVLYIMDLIPSEISVAELAQIWSKPIKIPPTDLTDGLGLSLASLGLLATVPMVSLIILAFLWILLKELLFAFLSLGIASVLVIAALGF